MVDSPRSGRSLREAGEAQEEAEAGSDKNDQLNLRERALIDLGVALEGKVRGRIAYVYWEKARDLGYPDEPLSGYAALRRWVNAEHWKVSDELDRIGNASKRRAWEEPE